jgi:hypothetical protein
LLTDRNSRAVGSDENGRKQDATHSVGYPRTLSLGRLKYVRIGHRWLLSTHAIEQFVHDAEREAAEVFLSFADR